MIRSEKLSITGHTEHVWDGHSPLMNFVWMPGNNNSLGNNSLWIHILVAMSFGSVSEV